MRSTINHMPAIILMVCKSLHLFFSGVGGDTVGSKCCEILKNFIVSRATWEITLLLFQDNLVWKKVFCLNFVKKRIFIENLTTDNAQFSCWKSQSENVIKTFFFSFTSFFNADTLAKQINKLQKFNQWQLLFAKRVPLFVPLAATSVISLFSR